MQLLIQPEKKSIGRYIKFCIKNNFSLEVDVDLLKKKHYFNVVKVVVVHGGNFFNKEADIINEIKYISRFHPKFIIYHDKVLEKLSKEMLKIINVYLLKSNIKLLIENIKYNKYNQFKKCFLSIKKYITNVGQCVDFGHVYLGGGDINDWTKKEYEVAHIHNNDGISDGHLSLSEGVINYCELNINLQLASYISLKLNCDYKSYINNIHFLIKNKIEPFKFPGDYLNLDFYRKIIRKKILNNIGIYKNNIVYGFFYGSFSNKECHDYSDLDCFICVKNNFNDKELINFHKQNCLELGFVVDNDCPIEIFHYQDVKKTLTIKDGEELSLDQEEIIKSHLMKSEFIIGDKKEYLKMKNFFYENYKKTVKRNFK